MWDFLLQIQTRPSNVVRRQKRLRDDFPSALYVTGTKTTTPPTTGPWSRGRERSSTFGRVTDFRETVWPVKTSTIFRSTSSTTTAFRPVAKKVWSSSPCCRVCKRLLIAFSTVQGPLMWPFGSRPDLGRTVSFGQGTSRKEGGRLKTRGSVPSVSSSPGVPSSERRTGDWFGGLLLDDSTTRKVRPVTVGRLYRRPDTRRPQTTGSDPHTVKSVQKDNP